MKRKIFEVVIEIIKIFIPVTRIEITVEAVRFGSEISERVFSQILQYLLNRYKYKIWNFFQNYTCQLSLNWCYKNTFCTVTIFIIVSAKLISQKYDSFDAYLIFLLP